MLIYIFVNKENPDYINTEIKPSELNQQEIEILEINLKFMDKILGTVNEKDKIKFGLIETLTKFSICVLTIGFYFYIIKSLQNYDLVQYSYFSFLLSDTNGLLVFLKFLNQNPKDIQAQFKAYYEE